MMINKSYLQQENINQIREVIRTQGSIQLHSFLEDCKVHIPKLKKYYKPESYFYKTTDFKDKNLTKTLKTFISKIYKIKKLKSAKIFCFEHRDYTIMNDKTTEEKGIKLILELTENWNQESNGYTSFTKNNKEIIRIFPINNTLTIIKTDKNMRSFVKYVNHTAKNNKRILIEIRLS